MPKTNFLSDIVMLVGIEKYPHLWISAD